MSQPTQNKISNLQDLVKQAPFLGTLFVVSFPNWFLWFAINVYLHGDALGTIPSRDGFAVKSHGHFTPVSESVWVFSLFYSGATMLLTPAIWIGAAARMIGGRLQQPKWFMRLGLVAFLIVWCLGWYSSIGRSFRRSVEDWQTLKRPNQSAAANRRHAVPSHASGNLSAIVAADRAFPAVVAEPFVRPKPAAKYGVNN